MILLSRRSLNAIAAVVDVALHARPSPVTAKALTARHDLPPRHLESVLQALVRGGVLKGTRGPRGGYELARERRRVSIGDILRATQNEPDLKEAGCADRRELHSGLIEAVIAPAVAAGGEIYLSELDGITVEDLCQRADAGMASDHATDFTI